jgi:hypothetical protein
MGDESGRMAKLEAEVDRALARLNELEAEALVLDVQIHLAVEVDDESAFEKHHARKAQLPGEITSAMLAVAEAEFGIAEVRADDAEKTFLAIKRRHDEEGLRVQEATVKQGGEPPPEVWERFMQLKREMRFAWLASKRARGDADEAAVRVRELRESS